MSEECKECRVLRAEVERLRQTNAISEANRQIAEEENQRLRAQVEWMLAERSQAVATAKKCCEDADFVTDWPDELHLSDVIEKRIYNLCLDWRHELDEAREAARDLFFGEDILQAQHELFLAQHPWLEDSE